MFSREPKVRLSDLATFTTALKEVFQAGVEAAKPGPIPEQYILTPEQILEEQKRMQAEAGWVLEGGGSDDEPDED